MRKIDMLKVRDILRLRRETVFSLREIAASAHCGKSTVSEVLKRAKEIEVSAEQIERLSDFELANLLYPPSMKSDAKPEPDMDYVAREIKKQAVTLSLLWQEYKFENPDGLMYSQFCDRYRDFAKANNVSYHKVHKVGDRMEVDWSGMKVPYQDPFGKAEHKASIFVSILPASSYPFVRAYENEQEINFIDGNTRALRFFGGSPRMLTPDNCKTAVTKADNYDPVLNRTFREFGRHYGIAIVPARPRKPKDKAADENLVKIVERQILAPLRNRKFFGIDEINEAIAEKLEEFINKPFQKVAFSRRELFEDIEKPALQPLPKDDFEICDWEEVKVRYDYHVYVGKNYYSVPYQYAGQRVWVRITARMIDVIYGDERIACHRVLYGKYPDWSTEKEHMPESHKAMTDWNEPRFIRWAGKFGEYTQLYIKGVLASKDYPQQSFNSCMAILREAEKAPAKLAESASKDAYELRTFSYKYFKQILKEKVIESKAVKKKEISHSNIRGASFFEGGGLNVEQSNSN